MGSLLDRYEVTVRVRADRDAYGLRVYRVEVDGVEVGTVYCTQGRFHPWKAERTDGTMLSSAETRQEAVADLVAREAG